ncbi:hypothetical protein [Novosphingobium panipatense]|uniref:hypothetical protein n=1 Tax=Novosphingobium panipatense TaxID=428991 RepID=UPI00362296F5
MLFEQKPNSEQAPQSGTPAKRIWRCTSTWDSWPASAFALDDAMRKASATAINSEV